MKIVCDACSAKYSIADEKVRGKVFKIRCKKCSNIIVVRGNAAEEQPQEQYSQQATRTFEYGDDAPGDDAIWHLVINQEQVGPMTEAEVRDRVARGEADLDTYTWREGFADWAPLGTVEPFTNLQAGADAAAGAMADNSATVQSDPGDLFAGAAAGDAGGEAGADLFGGGAAAQGGSEGLFGAGEADPQAGQVSAAEAERRLRGERNENSVLFSLNNLAALASESPKGAPAGGAPAPAASPAGGGGDRGGGVASTGGSEGSGLIDIRSMAQIYHGDQNKPAASSGSEDDLPVFDQSSFASAAPVLLPTSAPASNNNKPLYIMIGIVGALAVAAVVMIILLLKGGDKESVAANTPAATEAGEAGEAAAGDEDKPDKGEDDTAAAKADEEDKADEEEQAADEGAGEAADSDEGAKTASAGKEDDDDRSDRRTSRSRRSSGSSRRSSSSSRSSKSSDSSSSKKKKEDKPKSRSGGCLDEVGCLLADKPPACCSKYSGGGGSKKRSGGGSSSSANLPEQPSRGQITSSMGRVKARVTACGSRHPGKGMVKVSVKVAPSGSVRNVRVKSAPNSALGSCVASAVKRARFPKSQRGISFSYPYAF